VSKSQSTDAAKAARSPGNGAATQSKVAARLARTGEVLDLLRRGEAVTTSELAARMGVVRSTVTERLDLLLQLGLIVPAGATAPSRGRPAGILAFNARAGVTLVAQVGMSATMVAVADLAGEIRWIKQVELDVAEGPEALVDLLDAHFREGLTEIGEADSRIYGLGIGLPGDLEIASGGTPSESWTRFPLADRLSESFDSPVYIDHDVNFMALGEHRTAFPEAEVFICLKVGTVIACGIVVDGHVVRGASGLVGEIGHTKVPGSDAPCPCGSQGCLNMVAGGGALATQLTAAGFETPTARDVAVLANQGVVPAVQAVREAGRQIGDVMAAAVNLLNPSVVTVWGWLVDTGDQFLAGMQEAIYQAALPSSARAIHLAPSQLGDDAGVRGAALTVIEHALAPQAIDEFVAEVVEA
jgi:predicted NBD/HSP70 family sugar kinase